MFLTKIPFKYIATGAIILLISVLVGIVIYQYNSLKNKNAELQVQKIEMKQLKDGVVRTGSEYVTKKDLESFAKESKVDLAPIKKDLEELNATINGVSSTVSKSSGYSKANIPSTSIEPGKDVPVVEVSCKNGVCENPDKFGVLSNKQTLKLEEPFDDKKVPLGRVSFEGWKKNPWELYLSPREYRSVVVMSTDDNGRHFFHTQMSVDVDGENYKLPIASSEFKEVFPESKFRFDPALFFGLGGGLRFGTFLNGELFPNIDIKLFSYGRSNANPEWVFAGLGAGYLSESKGVAFFLAPVSYNIGKNLPLFDNTYIEPILGFDTLGNFVLLGGAKVGF